MSDPVEWLGRSPRLHIDCKIPGFKDGCTIYVTVNPDEDGRLRQVLILSDVAHGSLLRGLLLTIGQLASALLKHGVPLAEITSMWRHTTFEPSGWVRAAPLGERGEHGPFRAKSILDLVAAYLEYRFPDGQFRADNAARVPEVLEIPEDEKK